MMTSLGVILVLASLDGGMSEDPHCWDALPHPFPSQSAEPMTSTVAALDDGEIWVASDSTNQVARWRGLDAGWVDVALPTTWGELHSLVVHSSGAGPVFLGIKRNEQNGSSAARVARWSDDTGWSFVGERLPSTNVPYQHVNDLTLASNATGSPIALWTEELNVRPFGIFVARYDAPKWSRLGALRLQGRSYYVRPVLRPDGDDVWAAWVEEHRTGDVVRVARWHEGKWNETGNGQWIKWLAGLRELSVDLVSEGPASAWLVVNGERKRGTSETIFAHWDGAVWAQLPSPPLPGSRLARTDQGLLLAGTVHDETENDRLFVLSWRNERWVRLLSGLHLLVGVSSVGPPQVLRGAGGRAIIIFEEFGPAEQRSGLIQMRRCADGERPRTPPSSVRERDLWPRSISAAVDAPRSKMSPTQLDEVRRADPALLHHGFGTGIRNQFGLWRGNQALIESCAVVATRRNPRDNTWHRHPDTCSSIIIDALQESLGVRDAGSP